MSGITKGVFKFQITCPVTATVAITGPYGNQTVSVPPGTVKEVVMEAGPYTVRISAPGYATETRIPQLGVIPYYISVQLFPKPAAPTVPLTDFLVRVLDSKTSQEIPDASVWINGRAGKQSNIEFGVGQATVSARAEGYIARTEKVTVLVPENPTIASLPSGNGTQQVHDIALDPVLPLTVCAFLGASGTGTEVQALEGVTVTLAGQTAVTGPDVTPGQNGIPIVAVTPTGSGWVAPVPGGQGKFSDVPEGTYTVTAAKDGFEPFSQQIVVGPTRFFTFQLTALESEHSGPVGEQGPLVEYSASDIAASLDVAEKTYDNSAYQGYFTSAQCQLYIGELFIDELVTVQYALQQNTVPVYGYCSQFADAWGRGRSLVQGQIVVNYVHQGYLYAALANMKKYDPATSNLDIDTLALEISRTKQASVNPRLGPLVNEQAKQQLAGLLLKATPDDIQRANSFLRSSKTSGTDPYVMNPLYLDKVFDMRIVIGDSPYQSVRMLEGAKLTGNEQIVDARSGDVLGESYSFIARRLR
jgi:hypothetical protein